MIKNYFKIAWRNIVKNKVFSLINIVGLAIGLAVCMLIFIVIDYQTSFEGFHENKSQLYRVLSENKNKESGNVSLAKNVPFQFPNGLKTNINEIEYVAPIYASHDDEFQIIDKSGITEKKFKEQNGVFYTTPSFFKMFSFPLVTGSYESLSEPNNVLVTKDIAEKYFGDWKQAVGKTIKITGYYSMGAGLFQYPGVLLKISGVLAPIPSNTDLKLKIAISYGTDFTGDKAFGFQQPDWLQSSPEFGCFIMLPKNVSIDFINQQLNVYVRKTAPAEYNTNFQLQPIDDIHYDAEVGNFSNLTISHKLINVLRIIGGFILLIACVNFINLSTAQAVNRAKEVGVRKVLGGYKLQLQIQFLAEIFLIVVISVFISVGIIILAFPYINQLLDLSLSIQILTNTKILLFFVIIIIAVTIIAGFYPSAILARFSPINALKSRVKSNNPRGLSLRKVLVVFQFIIAQVLIIGTIVLIKQMNYFMNQPLGFGKEAIVNVAYRPGNDVMEFLKQKLISTGVESVSFNSNSPIEDKNMLSTFKYENSIKDSDFQTITKFVDKDYVSTFKLKLIAGRNLNPSGFTQEFLVNETFVKSLGLKSATDILGKKVSIMGGLIKCPVVGVLKDFNNKPLQQNLAPVLVSTNNTMYRQASIKIPTENMVSTLEKIKIIWEKTLPNNVFEYKFLDEKIASFYKQESQLAQLYKIFATIAVLLSCLGLYGLASFMAVQKVKEVGIRKILGASVVNIVYLFSKEFIVLVAIAFAIASPIAWYYMNQWLQNFHFRIDISWWIFPLSISMTIIVTLFTVSFQALKAALVNPVKSLKTE